MSCDRGGKFRPGTGRAGFTALEMLVVLGVIIVLSSMAVMAVVPSLRRGRVNDAAGAVIEVSRHARRLAMQRKSTPDDAHYGVVIYHDTAGAGTDVVALIHGHPGDKRTNDRDRIMLAADGKPVSSFRFSPTVSIWQSGVEMREAKKQEVSWYYQFRTGMPLGVSGSSLTTAPINIGTAGRDIAKVWGKLQAESEVKSLSPGTAADPGLSVRSVDNRFRQAIAVYISGIAVTHEF